MVNKKSVKNLIRCASQVFLFTLILFVLNCATNDKSNNAASSPANTAKTDNRVSIIDNHLSFVPPDGFKSLKIEQLKNNPIENDFPKNIFSNDSQSALIKVYYDEFELAPDELVKIKNRVEGMQKDSMITSEIIEMNGRQWFHFESETKPIDNTLVAPLPPEGVPTPEVKEKKPIHYQEYTTSFNKKNLRFVFESDAKEYSQIKEAFTKSIQTIQVKD